MDQNEKVFTVINDEGKEIKAEILFTHHSEEFNKDYVVFLPEDSDSYTAAYYNEDGSEGELSAIESDEEWAMLEQLLENYFDSEEDEEA